MKRLLVSVRQENLSTFVDIFVNHGKLFALPWLIAHHHCFFGNFNKLTILDILLKHRRGYNPGLGSKVRKVYFSDVNKILKHFHEFPISCCESFDATTAYKKSMEISDCTTLIHQIDEVEKYEPIYDSYDIDIDDIVREKKTHDVKEIVDEVLKERSVLKNGFDRFLTGLMKFSKRKVEEVLTQEQIDSIKKKKEKREEELEAIRREISNLNDEQSKLPKEQCFLYKEHMREIKNRTRDYKLIITKIITMIEKHDIVMKPINELARIYQGTKRFFSTKNDLIKEKISEYLELKKMHKYYTQEEIQHLCRTMFLEERVDVLNKFQDDLESIAERYNESPSRSLMSEYKNLSEICSSIKEEVEPLIESYELVDKNMISVDYMSRAISVKSLINYSLDVNNERTDFWEFITLNNAYSAETFVENLKSLLQKLENDEQSISDELKNDLKNKIKEVYEEEREYILNEINENRAPDKLKIESDYKKISELRRNVMSEKNNMIFDVEDFALNDMEAIQLKNCIGFLTENENKYDNYKRYISEEVTEFIYLDSNKAQFKRRNNIDDNLDEKSWQKALFKLNEVKYRNLVKMFDYSLELFEDITGFSPYGIIIGSRVGQENISLKDELIEINLFGHKKQESYYDDIIQNAKVSLLREISYEDVGCDYLRALVKGKRPDLNARTKKIKSQIKEKILLKEKEIDNLKAVDKDEYIYDILKRHNDNDFKVGFHAGVKVKNGSGKKIESDFNFKKLKRSTADIRFREIVTKSAILSKNIYDELQVEEAISDSNEIVNCIFKSEVAPYYCFDFKAQRRFRVKKLNKLNTDKANGIKGFDLISSYNEFNIESNSNANKNYSVDGMISYIKILVAFKLLNLNVNKELYSNFGLKKCQSDYLKRSLVSMARKMIESKFKEINLQSN